MKRVRALASRVLMRGRHPETTGTIQVSGIGAPVEVARDAWGIPHVRAASLRDLFAAQGFVHAQDRLWQMEVMRRLTSGRLSEIAGSSTLTLDWFCRMAGLPEMKRRVLAGASEDERAWLDAYAAGVNACIERMGPGLPLEFATLRFDPEPWTALDAVSTLPYLSWTLMLSHYSEKLLAIARAGALSAEQWNDIFPSFPGAELPLDPWFARAPGVKLGRLHPGALAFHSGLTGDRAPARLARALVGLGQNPGGSNNWAVARSADGKPLLANDPHLGTSLPAVWYFCHLEVPGVLNAAGASLAGSPGIVIGRNEHAAWGVTNVMMDATDILTCRVDRADPERYTLAGRELRMEKVPMVIGLPRGRSVRMPLYLTGAGPVITQLDRGITDVAVLKWYGTLPEGALVDRSFRGLFGFMQARTAAEVVEAARGWACTCQNLVAADDSGHIAWHATGAAPIRKGWSGRLPGDASAGHDWTGFVPYDQLPQLFDPADGWIATANHRPERVPEGPVLSHVWFGPWRVRRIAAALEAMRAPDVDDFRRLQMDVHSLQADSLLPRLEALVTHETALQGAGAREAAALLRSWDREVRAESAGAAVFEVFITELTRCLLSRPLGPDLPLFFAARTYGPENEIFDRPGSSLWTAAPAVVIEEALARTIELCVKRMGRNRARWSWGRLHRHAFRHPGARGRITSWLMNPPQRPAHGDGNTINVAAPRVAQDSYTVAAVPSLRMVVALGDPDGLQIIGPLGQSGQPGHAHYDDMTDPWIRGELVTVPLSASGVQKVARDQLVLAPLQGGKD
jgi:penicillin G amidase